MPINYQEIYTQIKQVGLGAKERRKKKEEAQELAKTLLETYSPQLDFLRSKVDSAKTADANIRCAGFLPRFSMMMCELWCTNKSNRCFSYGSII